MILNLYKPKGISSFNFINRVKQKFGYSKVGHAGTLDPLAEGVLIVLTDKDTKRQAEFMKQDKIYVAEVILGAFSESFDLEKPLSFSEKAPQISENKVVEVLKSLEGELTLPAPIYSAKSISGQRLYKLAKKGEENIDLPLVKSKIEKINLLKLSYFENEGKYYPLIEFEVVCSSGTYIRSIANHLGTLLETQGVLYSLKRTKVGEFEIKDSQRIEF
jgi:tRNA pseudouridine55 synthase